ncbi:MAG: 2-dehydropantoate 2-reductase [Candidatus Rokubacteria bacterium]|nr:2-dehydropantoate 2-reductase [Candidatus Rokubacteria bacterium]
MRVLVLGAGGVGGYFGGRLSRAGEQVAMLARGEHAAVMRRDGLTVRSALDGQWVVRPEVIERVSGPPVDLVLLTVKAFDTEAVLAQAREAVGPATIVLSLQNGVASAEAIEGAFGPGHALGGVAYVFAVMEAPGVIVHRFAGTIALGELDGLASARAARVRDAFIAAGMEAELSTEIQRVLWEKYVFICAQAGMTALTRQPVGVVREIPEAWRMYRAIVEEIVALGRKAGAGLPDGAVDGLMAQAAALAPEARSSLAFDLGAGKRLELDGLHGYAVRLGERLGVPTPMTFAVYAALKPYAGGRG